jgi:SepF-like predicted cell division protein (DUF552 family)
MPFNLFRKKDPNEHEKTPVGTQEEVISENSPEKPDSESAIVTEEPKQTNVELSSEQTTQEQPQETLTPPIAQHQIAEQPNKTYLKAMPLKELTDIEDIKNEVSNGNIIILKVTPLAAKSIEDVKSAVNELFQFAESIGGDIARLGEERVVICPKTVRIWREKNPNPTSSEPVTTAA